MPDDLLNLNIGQVQAVIQGYSDRLIDATVTAVWSGYYSAYYTSKHPKKPTEIIRQLTQAYTKATEATGATSSDIDMDAELERFAQRDLAFLSAKEGKF